MAALTYREKLGSLFLLDKDEHGYGSYPKSERVAHTPTHLPSEKGEFGRLGHAEKSTPEHGEYFHTAKDALDSLLNKETANIQKGELRTLLDHAGKLENVNPKDDPDLSDLHVDGKLIFGGNGLGIPRDEMPQVPRKMRDDFIEGMKAQGFTIVKEYVNPLKLSPTQREISAKKTDQMVKEYEGDKHKAFPPLLVANDGHVLDGHHHWSAIATMALDHPGTRVPVYRIKTSVTKALDAMKAYNKEHGIKPKAMGQHDVVDGRLDLEVDVPKSDIINLPFGEYTDFEDCVEKNGDKDDPQAFCGWLKHRIEGGGAHPDDGRFDLPNIADVSFPTLIGAAPSKPRKRKPYKYKGIKLSRRPMKFEAKVLSLTDIPPRLDLATKELIEADTDEQLVRTLYDIANYGAGEVLRELVRQGAPERLLQRYPSLLVESLWSRLTTDRRVELSHVRSAIAHKLGQRNLSSDRAAKWTEDLVARRVPAMSRKYAARAVNEAFAFGRTTAINAFMPVRGYELAKAYRDENGKFISVLDAVAGGDVSVDAVVQTAVMDTNTCEECEDVDGEVMDFGDDRQLELHPPYALCLGEDRCRCVQIAILDNGEEVNVDEIDEDLVDTGTDDDF